MPVSFDTTKAEAITTGKIVDRAIALCSSQGVVSLERLPMMMDLSACHANGCPMDFERLLAADDFNFMHDVLGIWRHLDRSTGKLGDCFHPRFAA